MRKMLLSFKADVYARIISGEKIYEHRRVFPDEPIEAYLYVSTPVQAVKGKLILGKRQNLVDWKEWYSDDYDAVKRIDKYLEKNRYAMEILEFRETNSIELSTLRREVPGFIVPQMYYYLDGTELLSYLEDQLQETGTIIKHDFSTVDSSMICIH